MNIAKVLEAAQNGKEISAQDAEFLLDNAHYAELAKAANEIRMQKHNNKKVSYTVFQIINYTNICSINCSFCSFKSLHSNKPYTLSLNEIKAQTTAAKERGAVGIFFQGGVNTQIPLKYYLDALEIMSGELPVRGFSPVELFYMAKNYGLPQENLLAELKSAGLSSVPGAGAEIMTKRMRNILAPNKLSEEDWCNVMETCHKNGLPGSANIVIGSVETNAEIAEHLNAIREIQKRTGGFFSFVPWVFQPQTNDFPIRHVSSAEYIKLLALTRIFFHNIPNIEVSVLGLGKQIGELALHSGANDINSIVLEERVMKSQGLSSIEEAETFIKNAGFEPVMRGMDYESGDTKKIRRTSL